MCHERRPHRRGEIAIWPADQAGTILQREEESSAEPASRSHRERAGRPTIQENELPEHAIWFLGLSRLRNNPVEEPRELSAALIPPIGDRPAHYTRDYLLR